MKALLFVTLFVLSLLSCGKSNPSLSDKQVKNLFDKETSALSADNDKPQQVPDSALYVKITPGVKFTEDRSVDPSNPPAVIDLTSGQSSSKELKLSDIAQSVRYIKLNAKTDTMALDGWNMKVFSYKDKIILSSIRGIYVFASDGMLTDTVWYNPELKKSVTPDGMSYIENLDPYFTRNTRMSLWDNHLIYLEAKKEGDQTTELINIYNLDTRKKEKIIAGKSNVKVGGVHQIDNNTYVIIYHTVLTDEMYALRTFNMQGDTLCKFSHYEIVKDFKGGSYASPELDNAYTYNNQFSFRHGNNDTLFHLVSPNRLVPAFVLKLGQYKVSINDLVRDKAKDKYVINGWTESSKYIMIDYTKDRNTPNNQKKGVVEYFNILFDKANKRLIRYTKRNFENNLDNKVPLFIPKGTALNGELIMLIDKKLIAKYITAYPEYIEKWKKLDQEIKENELLIMLAK